MNIRRANNCFPFIQSIQYPQLIKENACNLFELSCPKALTCRRGVSVHGSIRKKQPVQLLFYNSFQLEQNKQRALMVGIVKTSNTSAVLRRVSFAPIQ